MFTGLDDLRRHKDNHALFDEPIDEAGADLQDAVAGRRSTAEFINDDDGAPPFFGGHFINRPYDLQIFGNLGAESAVVGNAFQKAQQKFLPGGNDCACGDDCVVAFISSVKTKRKLAFDIAMSKSEGNGLKVDSVIKVNKLATLQKKIIIGTLGTLEPAHMTTVDKKLKQIFKLQ